uniref:Uncharacterized protein n=1 Tax=Knipowitschia caucasica TaxID=637954 RepID=A0AAV2JA14_KNICA
MNENQPTCPQAEASFASADEEMRQEDVSENDLCLPTGWKTTLPELDQVWISESLFRWSESSLPELDPMKTDHHWHYPPSPSSLSPQNCNGVPKLQQYFGHPLGKEFMKRFSQHMKKFHADKQKSPSVFQALLLDGLSRWNAARAGKSAQSPFSVRSSALAHSVNQLALLVCGEKVIDDAAPQECSGDFNSGDNDMEMAVKPCASSVQEPDCPREEQPQEEKPLLECENSALDFPDSNNTSTENAKCTEDASLFLTIVKVEEETLLSPCKEEDMESPIQPPNNIDMTPIKSEEIKVETLSDDVKEEPFLPPCSDEVLPAPVPAPVTPEQTQVAHTANAPPAGHFLPQQLATPSSLFITAGLPITSQRLLLAPVQLTAPPPPAPQKLMPILSAPAPQPLVRYVVNNAPGVLLLQPTTVSAPLLANASTIQHAETRGKSHRRILSKKL